MTDIILAPLLVRIAAHGNRGHFADRHAPWSDNKITCLDGFTVSVIAGGGTYCHPRPALCLHLPGHEMVHEPDGYYEQEVHDYPGPYDELEVGFPSLTPQPWEEWKQYAEELDDPTDTVYSYVPVPLVRALVERHGGELCLPTSR